MKDTAIILTSGLLASNKAKTAHGLIRGTDRYDIVAVLDDQSSGQDAGIILDGDHRNIPVVSSVEAAIQISERPIQYCIIGVATPGGIIPESMQDDLLEILDQGISIVNGLHSYLGDIPKFKKKAKDKNAELIDIRKGKPKEEQHFWSGRIFDVKCPIVAVLGTDCALGKRTTTRIIVEAAETKGINASMVFTGQTGWLQGKGHGFIFDSTVNDFVSGELENAICSAYETDKPDVIFLEGQASLMNPSGPCGSEYLVSGNAKKVILQHAPQRTHFKGWEKYDLKIPPIQKTIDLIKLYGSEVIGITLNTTGLTANEIVRYRIKYGNQFRLPVLDPLNDDMGELIDASIN